MITNNSVVPESVLDAGEAAYDAVPEGFNAHRRALGKAFLAMQAVSPTAGDGVEALVAQWQRDQSEFFSPTIVEIVSEYARWRETAMQAVSPTAEDDTAGTDRTGFSFFGSAEDALRDGWQTAQFENASFEYRPSLLERVARAMIEASGVDDRPISDATKRMAKIMGCDFERREHLKLAEASGAEVDALQNALAETHNERAAHIDRLEIAREALECAEVTLRLDGERMDKAGLSTLQNKEAHRLVSNALTKLMEKQLAVLEKFARQVIEASGLQQLRDRVEELEATVVALANGADKCAEAPHFIVQPFLAIYKKHGETIASARNALSQSKEAQDG